ncbi:fasciclin domain-containing protein [Isachenkonia alkalipeptolytica]|uniref:Fasciclin domain-containing protein n=2 Tax=Isachenkonia alkalipeptolytica TaxID=2565777 RepID=A0AA43XIN4_9CLOT|nr:fasciclin domain-containing protein [Isachenkonia alkalipeptolytica]NBG86904.1 fasciclin domain-containing protein [Isachenkonia alkalipeptolytica]
MVFAGRPDFAGPPANGPGQALPPGGDSIAAIAIGAGFSELVGALVYVDGELGTDLVGLFSEGTEQYTVFAPTNEAFEALYEEFDVEGIEELGGALGAELIRDVLFYHVAEGRRAANSVVPRVRDRSIITLQGASFSVSNGGIITDLAGQEAEIVAPNISASNGIIHVIDTVLLPLP